MIKDTCLGLEMWAAQMTQVHAQKFGLEDCSKALKQRKLLLVHNTYMKKKKINELLHKTFRINMTILWMHRLFYDGQLDIKFIKFGIIDLKL